MMEARKAKEEMKMCIAARISTMRGPSAKPEEIVVTTNRIKIKYCWKGSGPRDSFTKHA